MTPASSNPKARAVPFNIQGYFPNNFTLLFFCNLSWIFKQGFKLLRSAVLLISHIFPNSFDDLVNNIWVVHIKTREKIAWKTLKDLYSLYTIIALNVIPNSELYPCFVLCPPKLTITKTILELYPGRVLVNKDMVTTFSESQ